MVVAMKVRKTPQKDGFNEVYSQKKKKVPAPSTGPHGGTQKGDVPGREEGLR